MSISVVESITLLHPSGFCSGAGGEGDWRRHDAKLHGALLEEGPLCIVLIEMQGMLCQRTALEPVPSWGELSVYVGMARWCGQQRDSCLGK